MIDIYDENFGAKAKEIMERCGITRKELADFTGISVLNTKYALWDFPLAKKAEMMQLLDAIEKEVARIEAEELVGKSVEEAIVIRLKRLRISKESFMSMSGLPKNIRFTLTDNVLNRRKDIAECLEKIEAEHHKTGKDTGFASTIRRSGTKWYRDRGIKDRNSAIARKIIANKNGGDDIHD